MKDSSVRFLSGSDYSDFNLTTPDRVANFCDKQPVLGSCKVLNRIVMNCQTGKYIQHQNKKKPYHMKERLIPISFMYWIDSFTCGLTIPFRVA